MTQKSSTGKWAGLSLLSAIAASLCCITPVLAFIAGASGMAASFSWLEPARPWLAALTIGVLGFAWYQKLKPQPADPECACEEDGREPFLQSKTFLGIVTVFALVMLAFPWYAGVFYPDAPQKEVIYVAPDEVQTVTLDISGMTCTGCEEHVNHAVTQLPGVLEATASYKEGKAVVRFDAGKVDTAAIRKAVDATGYKVVGMHLADAAIQ